MVGRHPVSCRFLVCLIASRIVAITLWAILSTAQGLADFGSVGPHLCWPDWPCTGCT